jgi:hypothetical protein
MEWFLGNTADEMRIATAAFAITCPRCHAEPGASCQIGCAVRDLKLSPVGIDQDGPVCCGAYPDRPCETPVVGYLHWERLGPDEP